MWMVALLYYALTHLFELVESDGKIQPLTRIIGGSPVSIEDFPYQLALLINENNQVICSASLLTNTVAISAAHCFTNGNLYKIRAGSTYSKNGGIIVIINEVVIHPNYDRFNHDNDLAILYLNHSLEFSKYIQPITLPTTSLVRTTRTIRNLPSKNLFGLISGWGTTIWFHQTITNRLRAVQIPIINWNLCKRLYPNGTVTPRMFCAGYLVEGGKDACQGDSGGPFVIDGKLYGIISWGFSCAQPGYPGVYTNIAMFIDFIRKAAKL